MTPEISPSFVAGGLIAVAAPAFGLSCSKPVYLETQIGEDSGLESGVVLCPILEPGDQNGEVSAFDCSGYDLTAGGCFNVVDQRCGDQSNRRLTRFERYRPEAALDQAELYKFECTVPGKETQ